MMSNRIQQTDSACNPLSREYLLRAVRCARLRASLLVNEIDAVGCALKNELVSPDTALDWLYDIGASEFLVPEIGREAA
jgi:hypothetical protein